MSILQLGGEELYRDDIRPQKVPTSNADGSASGVHIEGTTHTSDGWYAVFDRTLSDSWVRVTWAVILGSAPIDLGQAHA